MDFRSYPEQAPRWSDALIDPLSDFDSLLEIPSDLLLTATEGSPALAAATQTQDHRGGADSAVTGFAAERDLKQHHRSSGRDDRKLAMSREVQRRFRNRQKVRLLHCERCSRVSTGVSVAMGKPYCRSEKLL